MHQPKFTFRDVKHAEDAAVFARAEKLVEAGKVRNVHEDVRGYTATVLGTHPYEVSLSDRNVDIGYCDCYLGQNDYLCKHMLALALVVLEKSGKSDVPEKEAPTELIDAKRIVSEGMRKIRAYSGPSSTWFPYTRSLAIGAGIITEAISALPATEKHADFLWSIVKRIDKKFSTGGVDDSDGAVGNCAYEIIHRIALYAKEKPELKAHVKAFCSYKSGFGFEDELAELLRKSK